jgi:hypothetical protein
LKRCVQSPDAHPKAEGLERWGNAFLRGETTWKRVRPHQILEQVVCESAWSKSGFARE